MILIVGSILMAVSSMLCLTTASKLSLLAVIRGDLNAPALPHSAKAGIAKPSSTSCFATVYLRQTWAIGETYCDYSLEHCEVIAGGFKNEV